MLWFETGSRRERERAIELKTQVEKVRGICGHDMVGYTLGRASLK